MKTLLMAILVTVTSAMMTSCGKNDLIILLHGPADAEAIIELLGK